MAETNGLMHDDSVSKDVEELRPSSLLRVSVYGKVRRPRDFVAQNEETSPPHKKAKLFTANEAKQFEPDNRPPCNIYPRSVMDFEGGKQYWYGGWRAETALGRPDASDSNVPDLHVLDMDSKVWTNLMCRLKYHRSIFDTMEGNKSFPSLWSPALAVARLPGSNLDVPFLFFYGGYNRNGLDRIQNRDLITVKLSSYEWSIVPVAGVRGPPRIKGTMIFARDCLYIFGGRSSHSEDAEGLRTFSILRYDQVGEYWSWDVSEQEFPPHVPDMGYDIRASLVHHGQKIMLAPGRRRKKLFINISNEQIVFFNTETRKFSCGQIELEKAPFPRNKIVNYDLIPVLKKPSFPTRSSPTWQPFVLFCCWLHDGPYQYIAGSPPNRLVAVFKYVLPPHDSRIRLIGRIHKIQNVAQTHIYSTGAFLSYPSTGLPGRPSIPELCFMYSNSEVHLSGEQHTVGEAALESLLKDSDEPGPDVVIPKTVLPSFITPGSGYHMSLWNEYVSIPLKSYLTGATI